VWLVFWAGPPDRPEQEAGSTLAPRKPGEQSGTQAASVPGPNQAPMSLAINAVPEASQPVVDLNLDQLEKDADLAIAKTPRSPEGYKLKGLALILKARARADYADRTTLLLEAERQLARASELSRKAGAKERANVNRLWSTACLELGNYIADDQKREEYLAAAERLAAAATKLDPQSSEAWDALAYAREGIAWLLDQKERYQDALAACNRAVQFDRRSSRSRPWVGRGRARYKWALGDRDQALLALAEKDLRKALRLEGDSADAAEAYYWLGCVELARHQGQTPAEREQRMTATLDAWRASLRLAGKHDAHVWEEACLIAWANLALAEAQGLRAAGDPKEVDYLRQADEQAKALEKYNRPEAALLRGEAAFLLGGTRENTLRIFEQGMKEPRSQDRRSMVNLLTTTAYLRLTMTPQDVEGALADARRARSLAGQGHLDRKTRAVASGTLGVAHYLRARETGREAFRPNAIEEFRAALGEAPDHDTSWMWNWLLADLLDRKETRTPAEEQELRERITRARQMFPDLRVNTSYREPLMRLHDKYHPESQ
jgi:hypothetical protein